MKDNVWEKIFSSDRYERITAFSFIRPYLFGIIAVFAVISFLTFNNTIQIGGPTGAIVIPQENPSQETPSPEQSIDNGNNSTETHTGRNQTG